MPNRTILNKYGLFVSQIHKVLKKKELERGDAEVINKARLVATLSSNHSWRVFRFLHEGGTFDKYAMRDEIQAAFLEGWKEINERDVQEVATVPIDEHAFSMVLMCIDEQEGRRAYKYLLPMLQKELIDGIEPIENREYV